MKLILITTIILVSCSRLSFKQYTEYKTANATNYTIDTLVAHSSYNLVYVPLEDIIAANETTLERRELKAEYAKMKSVQSSSFQLTIRSTTALQKQEKILQAEYFSIHMKKDIKAVTLSGDTLECRHFLFIPNGSIGNEFVFEMDFQSEIGNLSHILFSTEFPEKSHFKIDLKHFHKNYPSLKI